MVKMYKNITGLPGHHQKTDLYNLEELDQLVQVWLMGFGTDSTTKLNLQVENSS